MGNGDRFYFEHKSADNANSDVVGCKVDGSDIPFSVIVDPEANQLARWQLISKELEYAEAQLVEALKRISDCPDYSTISGRKAIYITRDNVDSVIVKSLVESAIVCYIKCFNQAKGRRVKLEVANLFTSKEGKKYLDHHIKVRELRDSCIAHAGVSDHEGSHMVAVIDPKPPIGKSSLAVVAHTRFLTPDSFFLEKTLDLVRYVMNIEVTKLQTKMDDYCKKVINNPKKYGADKLL